MHFINRSMSLARLSLKLYYFSKSVAAAVVLLIQLLVDSP